MRRRVFFGLVAGTLICPAFKGLCPDTPERRTALALVHDLGTVAEAVVQRAVGRPAVAKQSEARVDKLIREIGDGQMTLEQAK